MSLSENHCNFELFQFFKFEFFLFIYLFIFFFFAKMRPLFKKMEYCFLVESTKD